MIRSKSIGNIDFDYIFGSSGHQQTVWQKYSENAQDTNKAPAKMLGTRRIAAKLVGTAT